MEIIIKCTETSVSEFSNETVLKSLSKRELTPTEQIQLARICNSYVKELYFSDFENVQTFVDECIIRKKVGVFDINPKITKSINVNGDITLKSWDGVVIEGDNLVSNLFILVKGTHFFENFTISKDYTGNTFLNLSSPTSIKTNRVENIKISNQS